MNMYYMCPEAYDKQYEEEQQLLKELTEAGEFDDLKEGN